MLSSRNRLEIDSGRVFRWSFLVIFLLLEWFTWQRIGRRLMFLPVRRVPIVRIAILASWRAAFGATVLAGAVTLAASLFVSLIWQRLLDLWLPARVRPIRVVVSLPSRRSAGRQPAGSVEMRRGVAARCAGADRTPDLVHARGLGCGALVDGPPGLARVEAQPPAVARFLPVRHWPDLLRFTSRTGDHASFAVADPDVVLAWFTPPGRPDALPAGHRVVPQGVFDA